MNPATLNSVSPHVNPAAALFSKPTVNASVNGGSNVALGSLPGQSAAPPPPPKPAQAVPQTASSNPFAGVQQLVSAPSSAQIIANNTPFELAQSLGSVKSAPPGSHLNITV